MTREQDGPVNDKKYVFRLYKNYLITGPPYFPLSRTNTVSIKASTSYVLPQFKLLLQYDD